MADDDRADDPPHSSAACALSQLGARVVSDARRRIMPPGGEAEAAQAAKGRATSPTTQGGDCAVPFGRLPGRERRSTGWVRACPRRASHAVGRLAVEGEG